MGFGEVTARGRSVAVGAVVVAAGLGFAQALGYVLNVVAARWLGPDGFGALASLLSVLVIGSVIGGGVQAAGARRIALARHEADPTYPGAISRAVLDVAAWSALVVVAATLLLTPLVSNLLHLDGWWPMTLTALAFGPVTLAGAQYAVTQGRDDYWRLGMTYAIVGAGKGIGGIAGAIACGSVLGAMVGLLIGAYVALAIGLLLIRTLVSRRRAIAPGLVREGLHATHALGALFVLTNIDVILARVLLSADQAGLYAAGSIVTKVAFWLPQFVGVVAFTRMTGQRGSRATWTAVAAVSAIGAAVTLGTWLTSTTIVRIVGGTDYASISGVLWLFALTGGLFAVGQALLLSRIAQDDRRAVIAVWAAAALVLVLALVVAHSVTALVLCAFSGALALCAIAAVIAGRARPQITQ